jgi:hypothetical protein
MDGDGVPNWKSHILFPGSLFEDDLDIDGDGVPNFLDESPYNANVQNHRLASVYSESNPDLVKDLAVITEAGITLVDYTDEFSPVVVAEIAKNLRKPFWRKNGKCLKKLRYVLSYKSMNQARAKGYYLSPIAAIALPGRRLVESGIFESDKQLSDTITHELGHVAAYSCVQAPRLATLATVLGGWPSPEKPVANLEDEHFLTPMRENQKPLSYSFTNIHEWFAETFVIAMDGDQKFSQLLVVE